MADVAATVLHDVGNVLNSVNVSALGVADTLRASKAPMVGKVAEALLAHRDDLGSYLGTDERGALIPSYLGGLATTLERERDQVLEEIRSLQRNVDRIKVVIAAPRRST